MLDHSMDIPKHFIQFLKVFSVQCLNYFSCLWLCFRLFFLPSQLNLNMSIGVPIQSSAWSRGTYCDMWNHSLQREISWGWRQHELPDDSNYLHLQKRQGCSAGKCLSSRKQNQVYDFARHVEKYTYVQTSERWFWRWSGKRQICHS